MTLQEVNTLIENGFIQNDRLWSGLYFKELEYSTKVFCPQHNDLRKFKIEEYEWLHEDDGTPYQDMIQTYSKEGEDIQTFLNRA